MPKIEFSITLLKQKPFASLREAWEDFLFECQNKRFWYGGCWRTRKQIADAVGKQRLRDRKRYAGNYAKGLTARGTVRRLRRSNATSLN